MEPFVLVENLGDVVGEIPAESIVSRTFAREQGLKAIVFAFDTGQELSEHTASVAAMIQIIEGEATVTLGETQHELSAGAWIYMQPRLTHSIVAKTPLRMLLMMLESEKS